MMYFKNLFLMLNMMIMALVGQDPRKTISAFLDLNKDRAKWVSFLRRIVNRIFDDEEWVRPNKPVVKIKHTEYAALGWRNGVYDRSLWWRVGDD